MCIYRKNNSCQVFCFMGYMSSHRVPVIDSNNDWVASFFTDTFDYKTQQNYKTETSIVINSRQLLRNCCPLL